MPKLKATKSYNSIILGPIVSLKIISGTETIKTDNTAREKTVFSTGLLAGLCVNYHTLLISRFTLLNFLLFSKANVDI